MARFSLLLANKQHAAATFLVYRISVVNLFTRNRDGISGASRSARDVYVMFETDFALAHHPIATTTRRSMEN